MDTTQITLRELQMRGLATLECPDNIGDISKLLVDATPGKWSKGLILDEVEFGYYRSRKKMGLISDIPMTPYNGDA